MTPTSSSRTFTAAFAKRIREAAMFLAFGVALAMTPMGALAQATQGVPGSLSAVQSAEDAWAVGAAAYARSDYTEAVRWFRLAAGQGDAGAQQVLGLMYSQGEGVPQDYAEALRWFRLAADQGKDSAQYSLGVVYLNGRGVPQNSVEAVRWFRLAADQGHADAQYNLGGMYARGQGAPQNFVEAYRWFNLSAAQGNAYAVTNRDLVLSWMTPAQIAEGQRLSAEWWPR